MSRGGWTTGTAGARKPPDMACKPLPVAADIAAPPTPATAAATAIAPTVLRVPQVFMLSTLHEVRVRPL
ncbi:MAG: hypothetical protein JWR46_96 [Mycobacterium sp.]|nr:hypothetical protein [Mycobacterium sp.]